MISSDPFLTYGVDQTKPQRPAPLTGKIKLRADARVIYTEIVGELSACEDGDTLAAYLDTIKEEIAQFEAELDFYWNGDGADFPGLSNEIARARARVDGDTGAYTGNWS